MARPPGKWVPFAIVGVIVLLGVLLWFSLHSTNETFARIGPIVSIVGIVCTIIFRLLDRRRELAERDDEEQRNRAAMRLATEVLERERKALVRTVSRSQRLRLNWEITKRPVLPPSAKTPGDGVAGGRRTKRRSHGDSEEIGKQFLALPNRRLVILGKPGAGKTVLAMLLIRDILDPQRRDEPLKDLLRRGEPVPVLLAVASWDPENEGLDDWITHRLVQDYPGLSNAAVQDLVSSGRILPVLDGLDEMPPEKLSSAIGALGRQHGEDPLVVTCRSDEYAAAVATSGEALGSADVVEILPVTPDEAIRFLQALGPANPRWDGLVKNLREDPNKTLAKVLSSPLMVDLARTIYKLPDRDPQSLVGIAAAGGPEAVENLENHLLDGFIPAVYPPRESRSRLARRSGWDAASAERYLRFLAAQLQPYNSRDRDLAWWEIASEVPAIGRRIAGFVVGLVGGIALGLLYGLTAGLMVGFMVGPEAGLWVGLGVVSGVWLGAGIAVGWDPWYSFWRPSPRRLNMRIWDRLRRRHVYLGGLGLGLLCGFVTRSWIGLVLGLVSGIVLLLVMDLLAEVEEGGEALAVSPKSAYRSDRASALAKGLLATPLVPVFVYLTTLSGSTPLGVARGADMGAGTAAGLGIGLTAGMLITHDSAWVRFVVARAWLNFHHQLPTRLLTFLDDAYDRRVLRQMGARYQFRHARLQERLAERDMGGESADV
jgi:hypothetical protein